MGRQRRELRDDALRIIDALVRVVPLPRARRAETHELQAIALRKQVDAMRRQLASAEGEARASAREATRAIRARDAALEREASRAQAAVAAAEAARAQYVTELRDFRDAAAAKHRAFRREFIEERAANLDRMQRMDEETVAMERELAKVRADRRSQLSVKDGQVAKLQAELERAREGRVWARVREEEARCRRAEEERDRIYAENEALLEKLSFRDGSRSKEREELYRLRYRAKELEAKVATYDARSNRKFFEVEPLAQEIDRLRAELDAERAATAKYKAIAEPLAERFFKGGFTLASDLAAAECLTKAHVSANQVPLLYIIFARLFQIKTPTRRIRVPFKKVDGKMTYVEREVTY